jgi:hypothetical protein
MSKLTPAMREMLLRIERASRGDSALLALVIQAEGGRARAKLSALLSAGWVEHCGHSVIVTEPGDPAPAVRITPAGRLRLRSPGP